MAFESTPQHTSGPTDRTHDGRGSVLVTGGSGQLARDLASRFAATGWTVHAPTREELDVSDRRAVLAMVDDTEPDVIVNAAAWTNPQGCEDEPRRAWAVHTMAVRHLAEACRSTGAHLCQISTDYVFDGTPGRSHTEWDPPIPTSVYGRSKLAGEHEVPDGATVIRTSRLVGRHGNNVGRNVLRLARRNPDQGFGFDSYHRGCITFTTDLSVAVERIAHERMPGVFHVTNQGVTTWYEFARAVLEAAGEDPDRVSPVDGSRNPAMATRPEYSVLENVALAASGMALLPEWRESVTAFVGSLHDE